MKTRDEFPEMLLALGLTDTAVEVGTYRGAFAHHWLLHWPGTLYCVDAWQHRPAADDLLNHTQSEMDECFEQAKARLAEFAHRNVIIRQWSLAAAARFAIEEEEFDAVYLDAAHDYDSVVADLAAWYPLVKSGGILAGHDYLNGTCAEGWPADFGVKQAVDEFAAREGLTIHTTTHESFPTWWVNKP
jgi:predicted O-methyltransferase YrrM